MANGGEASLSSRLIQPLRSAISSEDWHELCEIRLRVGQVVRLRLLSGEKTLPLEWGESEQQAQLMSFLDNSFYAYEEQVRQGFITLPGGHRVGLCGVAWYDGDKLGGFRDIGSMNVRVAREVTGGVKPFWPYVTKAGRVLRTLIAAPPGVGKTTLLRDLARGLSDGESGIPPKNVGIADERREIAAVYAGSPGLSLGSRSDVVSGCEKALGLQILLRTMSPDVLVTDEIGTAADAAALQDAMNAGVAVLASAHAADYEELLGRPNLRDLLLSGYFERIIFLKRQGERLGAKAIYDGSGERLL